METVYRKFDIEKSVARIDRILTHSDAKFDELEAVPLRNKLTFSNGFYVDCTCIYMRIRESAKLPAKYDRPTLGKIYRSFVSESIAILNSTRTCREIKVHGDAVCGIFDTPYKDNIDMAFGMAAAMSSVSDILNCRYKIKAKNIEEIRVGIGIAYGRAFMMKAGRKAEFKNEVVWMGEVLNEAQLLSRYGNLTWTDKRIMVSDAFYENLSGDNKKLLIKNFERDCYHSDAVNTKMGHWVEENSK